MNCITQYKILLDDKCLNDDEFDDITDITIKQTVDMIWEARIQMSIRTDEKGVWNIRDKNFAKVHSRARIEIKKDKEFVCLIDGPIVTIEANMESEPGRSSITLVIYDDSILLDIYDELFVRENKRGVEIVREIYDDAITKGILESSEIMEEVVRTNPKTISFRGTRMGLLRQLAKENQVHAYMLPGLSGKKSTGFFNAHPKSSPEFTDLFLLGDGKNIESFNVNINTLQPLSVKVSSLNEHNKKISSTVYHDNEEFDLLGNLSVIQKDSSVNMLNTSFQFFHPNSSFTSDNEQVVKDQINKSWYTIEATGRILETSDYHDILSPYNFITVKGVNPLYCGKYFLTNVTHNITPMFYSQSFTMSRNAFSDPSKAGIEKENII